MFCDFLKKVPKKICVSPILTRASRVSAMKANSGPPPGPRDSERETVHNELAEVPMREIQPARVSRPYAASIPAQDPVQGVNANFS